MSRSLFVIIILDMKSLANRFIFLSYREIFLSESVKKIDL